MEDDLYNRIKARAGAKQAGSSRPIIGAALAAFLLGGAVVGLAAWNFGFGSSEDDTTAQIAETEDLAAPTPSPSDAEEAQEAAAEAAEEAAVAVQAAEIVAEQQGGTESRVVAMEQRLDRLTIQAEAAYGNTARAEGLLIAFAARRAIERGSPLDYLEEQIQVRFGDGFPNAVAAVLEAAENPVTIDRLRASLDGLEGQLLANPREESGWEWFQREVSQLFIIRRQSTPSPAPERRLERARIFLETGQLENAIGEVRQMPGADRATQWIAEAERYAAALRALDLLETSAIVGSEELRDAEGNPVEQTAGSV